MRSLFRRTILAFILSFILLLVVLTGALVGGYHHSMSRWSERRIQMIESAARDILAGESPPQATLPQDVPVFVYDPQGALVAANRGGLWRREADHWDRIELSDDDAVIGSYEVGQAAFRNDAANRALTQALIRTSVAGGVAALAVAMISAWIFARSLSRPAARVAAGIDSIADGSMRSPIPEQGAEEISRIAKAANTLAARLQGERALRAQWAQDVTHDLRTPVASIRAQLEAVVDGVYEADPGRISGTLAELGRVEVLIRDLDELMRLESPEIAVERSVFSASGFVSTLRQRFGHEIDRRRIDLVEDIQVETISGDEALLDRAVSNLVANAVRHVPEGGTVDVTIRTASDPCGPASARASVEIIVRNEGPAIPENELPHLFDRLFRGEYARTSPGSGLGLTIARRIVLLHEGTIDVTSSTTEGTTVAVRLPRRATTASV